MDKSTSFGQNDNLAADAEATPKPEEMAADEQRNEEIGDQAENPETHNDAQQNRQDLPESSSQTKTI